MDENKGKTEIVVDHVVEQRVSNLAQGLLILGTMTGPLLVVLGLIPQAVLAGLFFVMGIQALESVCLKFYPVLSEWDQELTRSKNGMTLKLLYLCKDRALTYGGDPLNRCRKGAIWSFVVIELVGFGATFAITQTIAAIGWVPHN